MGDSATSVCVIRKRDESRVTPNALGNTCLYAHATCFPMVMRQVCRQRWRISQLHIQLAFFCGVLG